MLKSTLNLNSTIVDLHIPKIMGILNVTPDSFYDGGMHNLNNGLLEHVQTMLSNGATIIDIGGASSRPNADIISEKEEINRILPVIQFLIKNIAGINISVDTYRSKVAKIALDEGACMVNDISGGQIDPFMFETIGKYNAPYVLMHMEGTPENMMHNTNYEDILTEMLDYYIIRIKELKDLGVKDIILDLGFGFSKNIQQNYELLKKMSYFNCLNLPLMVGVSRKSMIYKSLDNTPQEALNGTTVLNTIALLNGAKILRVHDVKEAMETIKLVQKLHNI